MAVARSPINPKQLARLATTIADAILPTSTLLRRGFPKLAHEHRKWIPLLVFGLFCAVMWVSLQIDFFPRTSDAVFFADTEVSTLENHGVRRGMISLTNVVSLTLAFLLLIAFVLDFRDWAEGASFRRFIYFDPDHDLREQLSWSLGILLGAYLARLILFGICAARALEAANIEVLLDQGILLLEDWNNSPRNVVEWIERGVSVLVSEESTISLPREIGFLPRATFVLVVLARLALFTLLLGTFACIPPQVVKEIDRRTQRQNASIVDAVAHSFDRAARLYQATSIPQQTLADELYSKIKPVLKPSADVLEFGCGTGALTRHLGQDRRVRRVLAIDFAPGMIERTRDLIHSSKLSLRVADVRALRVPNRFDLICSSAVVQWLDDEELLGVYDSARTQLDTGGYLATATFGPATLGELYGLYSDMFGRPIGTRATFRSAEDLADIATRAGFSVTHQESETRSFDYFDAQEFFDSLRGTGVTGSKPERPRISKAEFQDLKHQYAHRFETTRGGVGSTWEFVIQIAQPV